MRKCTLALTLLLALSLLTACSAKGKEPQQPNDVMTAAEVPASPQPVGLNLPLVVKENTYYGYYSYVSADGVFKEYKYAEDTWQWLETDTEVRSLHVYDHGRVVFYIKNDNSLWAYGGNYRGILGDGSGDDQARPVKILDDVAIIDCAYPTAVAIKTDKSLWAWGNGVFAPVMIADEVVGIIDFDDSSCRVLKSSGLLYRYRYDNAPQGELLTGSQPGADSGVLKTLSGGCLIQDAHGLWRWDSDNPQPYQADDNVCALLSGGRILLNNGQVLKYSGDNKVEIEAENVRLPQTIIIP